MMMQELAGIEKQISECLASAYSKGYKVGYEAGLAESKTNEGMTKAEYDKIIYLMNRGALQGIDTGRLDGKCEDVIPLEDASAIVYSIYKAEARDKE